MRRLRSNIFYSFKSFVTIQPSWREIYRFILGTMHECLCQPNPLPHLVAIQPEGRTMSLLTTKIGDHPLKTIGDVKRLPSHNSGMRTADMTHTITRTLASQNAQISSQWT